MPFIYYNQLRVPYNKSVKKPTECVPSNLNTSNYGLIGMSISCMHQLTKVLQCC